MSRVLLVLLAACSTAARPPNVAPPVAKPPSAPVVAWTELTGPIAAITTDADVAGELAALRGKPIDRDVLRAALARILAKPGVADVEARGVQRDDGIELVVTVVLQPRLRKLVARDDGGMLVKIEPDDEPPPRDRPLDPDALDAFADKLRDRAVEDGYIAAAARWQRELVRDGIADVVVEVIRGERATVDAVDFTGNAHMAGDVLRRAVVQWLAAGGPATAERVGLATSAVAALYRHHGYLDASVSVPDVAPGRHPIEIAIVEGGQYRAGVLGVTGVPAAERASLVALYQLSSGDVVDGEAMADARERIIAAMAKSHPHAQVHMRVSYDPARFVVDAVAEITE